MTQPKSPHDAKSSPTIDKILEDYIMQKNTEWWESRDKAKSQLLAHDLALLPEKDYKNGKPEPRTDYDCDCGYSYDDCMCETNRIIDLMAERLRRA